MGKASVLNSLMQKQNLVKAAADVATNGNVAALARLIDTPDRTVRDWLSEKTAIPGAARVLLQFVKDRRISLFDPSTLLYKEVQIEPPPRTISAGTFEKLDTPQYPWKVMRVENGELDLHSPLGYVFTLKVADIVDCMTSHDGVFLKIRWRLTLMGSRILTDPAW